MARIVQVIQPTKNIGIEYLNVCAYARVSSGKDAMMHSLSAQISYYQTYIQRKQNWRFRGVYADEAISGTKDNRDRFNAMLEECRKGHIDLIVTKSISRFARNTITLLETIRELKDIGVNVYFEEQNINTLSAEGEVLLTLLASYAQEEARSASENQKWRVLLNFKQGKPWCCTMFGYRHEKGKFYIVEREAEIIRWIYKSYLEGRGTTAISNDLAAYGEVGRKGHLFSKGLVMKILRNYTYTGNLILQTTFRENYMTKVRKKNEGQLPMYQAEDTHEPIIDLTTFKEVQAEIARREKEFAPKKEKGRYAFTGLIKCENCGKGFRRKTTATRVVWICSTFNTRGKMYCHAKQIPEETLEKLTADLDLSTVKEIRAAEENKLTFVFKDGKEEIRYWKDRSRSESWTEEKRKKASEDAYRREYKCRKLQ